MFLLKATTASKTKNNKSQKNNCSAKETAAAPSLCSKQQKKIKESG